MPYYNAGDYYRGDYYRGDFLGIGKFVGKVARGVLGAAGGFVQGGPLGAVRGAATGVGLIRAPSIAPMAFAAGSGFGGVPEPGITGMVHRMAPGGHPGYGRYTKKGTWTERRRPRMQVTNTRALKRAGRRVRGFLKVASRLGALPISRSGKGKLFKRKRHAR